MAFQLSPGVNVSEIDLTTIVPAVGTTGGGVAGPFRWGPVEERVLVDNELTLVDRFGEPDNDTANAFFSAANFLQYGNTLHVVRAATANAKNATADGTGLLIKNRDDYEANYSGGQGTVGEWAAKYPGALGNSILVSVADKSNFDSWAYKDSFDGKPGTSDFVSGKGGADDEVHVAIVDDDGEWTGTPGTLLERFSFVSKAADAEKADGSSNYYATVVNDQSKFVWWMDHPAGTNWGSLSTTSFDPAETIITFAVEPTRGTQDFSVGETVEVRGAGVAKITVDAGGSGYTSAPAVVIEGGNGSGASATAVLTGGAVSAINMTSNGSGYTFPPTVSLVGGGGTGATATAKLDKGVDTITITNGGSGYTSATVSFSGGNPVSPATATATVVGDAVDSITITDPGVGYESAPTVTITGDGSNATATATILANGAVQKTAVVKTWDDGGGGGPFVLTVTMATGDPFAFEPNEEILGASSGVLGVATTVQAPTNALAGGVDDNGNITNSEKITAYNLFLNADEVDISLLLGVDADTALANHLIGSIAEVRKDAVVFLSPERADVVNNSGSEHTDTIAFRNTLTSTSYAFMDSNWKYQFDRYNSINRWLPLNGDIAGLAVRTDRQRDPWFSPAGPNRGLIKNVIRLAWNPRRAFRDELYKNGINPVVSFPGEGPQLFGDKTLLAKPSAFDRINVRRLFIVLEKAIATAARFILFEFNDQITRAQFRNLVEPFLRDVQGRRGIQDFRVVADSTNNTPTVIDSNRFVGDIYIKPNRVINFIQLNFIATPTGVQFEEIVGRF